MKKISIIVPVYNAEEQLEECLDSLVNQTLKDIEIIVINDGSEDNSLKILKDYQKRYPNKIILIDNPKNLGIGKTRNKGIKKATGEYLGFVDSDDYVQLNMYEEYYNYAKDYKLDIVTGYYNKIHNKSSKIFYNTYFKITNLKENPNLINLIDYGPATKIFKRSIVMKNKILFDEKLKYEDVPFTLNSLRLSKRVGHIEKAFYNYRIHDNSETTTMDKRVFDMFKIMDKINKEYNPLKIKQELEYLNIRQITMYMLQQKKQKDKDLRNKFIEEGYNFLNKKFPRWKENKYYTQENKLKQLVKNNKLLLSTYCALGR